MSITNSQHLAFIRASVRVFKNLDRQGDRICPSFGRYVVDVPIWLAKDGDPLLFSADSFKEAHDLKSEIVTAAYKRAKV